jgi:hypothetical protein
MRWFLPLLLSLGAPSLAAEVSEAPAPIQLDEDARLPLVPAGWETVKGPFVHVHGASEDLQTLVALSRVAERDLPRLANDLGVPLGTTVHVYVADSQQRFRALQPGDAPTWADGVAYPSLGLVLLRAPDVRGGMAEPLETVLRHELVHVLLGHAFLPNPPPSWLQEGLAQVWAGEVGPETTATLATGLATGNVLSLDGLSRGFPADPVRARIAYAQSAAFIGWLRDTYGQEAVRTLIREMATGTAVEGAIHAATGDFLPAVEARWRAELEGSPLALGALANMDGLLGLGGILLVVGGVARRRRFHRRLEEMGEEEAALDALIASYHASASPVGRVH